jgi:methionyl-tRNA synthetase
MPESKPLPLKPRSIIVTSALPYANGPLHLGHMLEHIQTDIWARFQRSRGHQCFAVCADDGHGTAIMLKAEQLGISAETLLAQSQAEHQQDLADFQVAYDSYHSTHSAENKQLVELFYQRAQSKGHIVERQINQFYDPDKQLFLADRYIKGTCPRCGSLDQYGDNCEACGATYTPADLIDPRSAISGAVPVKKQSRHYFFQLADFTEQLKQWTHSGKLQEQVANKLDEWFTAGLQDWDISRDAPYFGFQIPGTKDKYFYVWLDAPIGYMASFKKLCQTHKVAFDDFWSATSKTELHHFIGKDIIYFHALFWPALLMAAEFRTPTRIHAHGYVTVNGAKMSKSRGTFITARNYLAVLDPEYLRYYYAAKLSQRIDDIDLNLEDFMQRVNSDLVGKLVNIASRCAGFINKLCQGKLANNSVDEPLYQQAINAQQALAEDYENRDYSKAIRKIMGLADQANQYIDQHKPWLLAKQPGQTDKIQQVCSLGINLFRLLVIYLQPVLPVMAQRAAHFLQVDCLDWQQLDQPLVDHRITQFEPLLKRIDKKQIEAMLATSQANPNSAVPSPSANETKMIDYQDFAKIDLRIARIIKAEEVAGSDKLLKLVVDLGSEQRQIFAGIKAAYQPQDLVNKLTLVVANLKPRKMRFGLSEGMVLATGPGGKEIWLLSPDEGAKPGMQVS